MSNQSANHSSWEELTASNSDTENISTGSNRSETRQIVHALDRINDTLKSVFIETRKMHTETLAAIKSMHKDAAIALAASKNSETEMRRVVNDVKELIKPIGHQSIASADGTLPHV